MAQPGAFGTLNLPSEIVSSEFLTMSGSKFSTSRGTVIYVTDFLREFGPDALRYFISVAGPENQDTDFTWDEFVRRTNFELANEWGNLVNRSISMAHRNVGAVPKPNAPADADHELLAVSRAGFDTVGEAARAQPVQAGGDRGDAGGQRGQPVPERPGAVEARATNRTGATPSCTPHCRSCRTRTRCSPRSCRTPRSRCTRRWAGAACGPPSRRSARCPSSGDGPDYPVLTGDYAAEQARWASTPIEIGRPLAKPTPIFTKLDPKLGETGPSWAPITP